MILALLEQFQILSLIHLTIFGTDFSITNFLVLSLTTVFSLIFIIFFNCAKNINFFDFPDFFDFPVFPVFPDFWQYLLEFSFRLVLKIVDDIFLNSPFFFGEIYGSCFLCL